MFKRKPDHSGLSWREFEVAVEDLVKEAVDEASWRIASQRAGTYIKSGGETVGLRLDLHLAERKQGGKGVVIDAKHFKFANLNRNEVDSAEEYRKRCKASFALLAVSETTRVPKSVSDYIDDKPRFGMIRVDGSFKKKIRKFLKNIATS